MLRLPASLRNISDVRLAYYQRATERDLKTEIDRVCAADIRFARALRQALAVEDEIEWRAGG